MATHSSTPAWEISWTEEPGRRVHEVAGVRHDLVTNQQQQRPPRIRHSLYFYSLLEELGGSSTIQYFWLAECGSGMGTLFPVICPKGIFHEDPGGYVAVQDCPHIWSTGEQQSLKMVHSSQTENESMRRCEVGALCKENRLGLWLVLGVNQGAEGLSVNSGLMFA